VWLLGLIVSVLFYGPSGVINKVGIALFVITVALGKTALFHGVLCVCMEENNTFSLTQKGQTDVSIAFYVAKSKVLKTVVLKDRVFCLARDTMLLSECNNILKNKLSSSSSMKQSLFHILFCCKNISMDCHLDIHCMYVIVCAVITLLYCMTFPQGQFFGMFAKLTRATVSFTMSACPSTCNNSAPTRWIFMKFDISVFFENLLRKFKFDQNMIKRTSTLLEDLCTFIIVSH
jgi:hypothetical protein